MRRRSPSPESNSASPEFPSVSDIALSSTLMVESTSEIDTTPEMGAGELIADLVS